MNKMVRFLTGILFTVLLILPSQVGALELTVSSADGSPSEVISLNVTSDGMDNLLGALFYVTFDTTKLSYVETGSSLTSSYFNGWLTNIRNDTVYIVWGVANEISIPADDPLFTIDLVAAPDASGSTEVKISQASRLVFLEHGSVVETAFPFTNGVISFTPLDVDDDPALPRAFTMSQNYPNPFNPETKIDFDVNAHADRYFFRVYNMAGQMVEERDLGVLTAGPHKIEFTGEHLPSGLYLYQVASSSAKASKLMMLVK